jgi:hypothetical protein
MPTLDDAPTIATLTDNQVAEGDLIQIYDVSEQKPKTITFAELIDYITAETTADEI